MISKAFLRQLVKLERLMAHHQAKAKQLDLSQQPDKLQQRVEVVERLHQQLKHILQQEVIGLKKDKAATSVQQLEQAHTLSPAELEATIQETWPDFLPSTTEIIENCNLVVYNLGWVTYEQEFAPVAFAINENKVEHLAIQPNTKGTIAIFSNWRYVQKNSSIGIHTWGNDLSESYKNYKITCSFEVEENGSIHLYKDKVFKTAQEDINNAELIFHTRDIEVDLDSNDRLSITGGTSVNNLTVFPPTVKKWMQKRIKGKEELRQTFSLKLSLNKTKPTVTKEPTVEQELIFEKENQAVLSSDQREVCLEWWEQLKPDMQEAIRNRKVKIRITGYTSPPGSTEYNVTLAKKRAKHVAKMLVPKIGFDMEEKSVAIIELVAMGEDTSDPKRYVKIEVIEL